MDNKTAQQQGKTAKEQEEWAGYQNKQETTKHTHTQGKGKMSQNKQVRKNSASESKKKKNANSANESKRKTPQTREENDRGKHTQRGKAREETREEGT